MEDKEITPIVVESEEKKETEIKRGLEVETGKQGLIYTLVFLKNALNFYLPYLLDWSEWLEVEDNYVKREYLRDLFGPGEDERIDMAINMRFEDGLCQNIINDIIHKVNNTINFVEKGFGIEFIKGAILAIEDSAKKLDALIAYRIFRITIDDTFCMNSMYFYDMIVTSPLYYGFDMISDTIKSLGEINEEWFYAKSEYYKDTIRRQNNVKDNAKSN